MSNKRFTVSNKVRRFHNIPLHQPLRDLPIEEIRRLKEEYRQALPQIRKQRSEEGFLVEDKFIEAWSDSKFFPEWIMSVRKATIEEDHFKKTDAVIICTDGVEIPIQIKLRKRIQTELLESLYRKGITVLSIQLTDRPRAIRSKTLDAINRFKKWKRRQPK